MHRAIRHLMRTKVGEYRDAATSLQKSYQALPRRRLIAGYDYDSSIAFYS